MQIYFCVMEIICIGGNMILFISFLLIMAGCVNWLLIGLLQYDFVAGIFGYQGSLFSRIIYIIIGVGAIFFLIKVIMQKGRIELFNFKKKKAKEKHYEPAHNIEAGYDNSRNPRYYHGYESDDGRSRHNLEARRDYPHHDDFGENLFDHNTYRQDEYDSLFDEHFSNDD